MVVGEFQPCSIEFNAITGRISESYLLKSSVPPNNHYVLAKITLRETCILEDRTRCRQTFELKFEARPWQYSWQGNRVRQSTKHAFVVSVLLPAEVAAEPVRAGDSSNQMSFLNLIHQEASPSFRISCMRRSTKRKQEDVVLNGAVTSFVADTLPSLAHSIIQLIGQHQYDGDGELDSLLSPELIRSIDAHRAASLANTPAQPTRKLTIQRRSPHIGLTAFDSDNESSSDYDDDDCSSPVQQCNDRNISRHAVVEVSPRHDCVSPTKAASTVAAMHTVTPPRCSKPSKRERASITATSIHSVRASASQWHDRLRSPFSLECDAIRLEMAEAGEQEIGGLSATTTTESFDDDFAEAPHSLALTAGKYCGLTAGGSDSRSLELTERRVGMMSALWDRCQSSSSEEKLVPLSMPIPAMSEQSVEVRMMSLRKRELSDSSASGGVSQESEGESERSVGSDPDETDVITLPKKISTYAFYATHNAPSSRPLTATSRDDYGSRASLFDEPELVALPLRGNVTHSMRPSTAESIDLFQSPPQSPLPTAANHVHHGAMTYAAVVTRTPHTTHSASSGAASSGDVQDEETPSRQMVHGFPAFPSSHAQQQRSVQGTTSSIDHDIAYRNAPACSSSTHHAEAVLAAATSCGEGTCWSPQERRISHSKMLNQLFPGLALPAVMKSEEEAEEECDEEL